MAKRHVQAELTSREYEALRRASRRDGCTMKEALREAAMAWTRAKEAKDDPLFQLVGLAKGPKASSKDHDEIYDEA
jgi:hypothetical protein